MTPTADPASAGGRAAGARGGTRGAVRLLGVLAALLAVATPLPAGATEPARAPLRVGVSGDYPPFSLDGGGFDVEVARRLGRHLRRPVEWVPFRWPELAAAVEQGRFELAMSGITWRPERAVVGWMSRAVARGGPCVVLAGSTSLEAATRLAVNRGGILEAWARTRFGERRLVVTDDNRSLPSLLHARGVDATDTVDGVVTDRFEAPHVAAEGDTIQCEPATDRKVYWVAPQAAARLGPALDEWLRDQELELEALRLEHFGERAPLDELDHLIDLIGRRLELMPAVAAWKRARGLPIEDSDRERAVLERATAAAVSRGLDPTSVGRLFRVQIELAKAIQERTVVSAPATPPALDLESQLRPAISSLGDRIVEALARIETPPVVSARRLELLSVTLRPEEIAELGAAIETLCTKRQRRRGVCPALPASR